MAKKDKDKSAKKAEGASEIDMSSVAELGEQLCASGATMGSFGAVVSFFQSAGAGFQMDLCTIVGEYLQALAGPDGLKKAMADMVDQEDEAFSESDVAEMAGYLNDLAASTLGLVEPLVSDEYDGEEDEEEGEDDEDYGDDDYVDDEEAKGDELSEDAAQSDDQDQRA